MGPVVNAKVYKAQVLLGHLLISCLSMSPSASQIRGGGWAASTSEENHLESLNAHARVDAPPKLYRALSRRSVGRYMLATSSVVGECARVYTPAPLSGIASSLCSRLSIGLGSRGRDAQGSSGERKPSGLSYDKFMSPHKPTDDEEDLCGDGHATAALIPPDKYGRVSSAFLLRHEIGGTSAGTSEESTKREEMDASVDLPAPVISGNALPTSTPVLDRRRPSPQAAAGSVFQSIGSLRRDKRRKPVLDDMDLLSESDDDGDPWNVEAAGDEITKEMGVCESPSDTDSVRAAPKTTVGRNLVDVDDAATSLVNKLRLGKKSGAGSHGRNRRKRRRERKLNRGSDLGSE